MNSSQQHQLPSKQLRSQLRGVVSHRVMQITRQSKQQQQQPRTDSDKSGVKLQRLGSFNLTQTITTPTQIPATTITPPKKLADKASLVEHCRAVYREAVDKDLPVVQTAKSIIDAISDYSRENSLNIAATVESILKENLFKTEQQLKLFYNNEPTDKMKTEAELKIILQIENYILSNTTTTAATTQTVKVDDDFIWEVANSIKWLSRTFKQRFKIEKFLFGEIYNAYHMGATNEMVKAIMEELGYDKDDENKSDSDSEADGDEDKENDAAIAAKKAKSPVTSPIAALLALDTQESVDGGEFNTPVKKPPAFELYATKETSSLSTTITSRVSCLFEDTCSQSANDIEPSASNFYDELSQTGASFCYNEDTCDVLNEFKSRKLHSRSNSHSLNSVTINRSVVVQRKRTQLKIRSPHKSPSKRLMVPHDIQRKSPRLRDKQLLLDDNDRKRPRSSCLVTDTPDHKQTSLLTIKQEKRRKRFSVIDQANNSPIIPETPAKDVDDDGHKNEDAAPKIISISSRYRDLMFSAQSRSYSLSPKKSLSLRK